MGRLKGSKNKKKVESVIENQGQVVNEGEVPGINTKKVVAASTYDQVWTPKPVVNVVEHVNLICSECQHNKEMHYGGSKNWCNTPNCRCDEWKS